MKSFENSLKLIYESIDGSIYSKGKNFTTIFQELNDFIEGLKKYDSNIGLCSSLLFNKKRGILYFADKTLTKHRDDKDYANARKCVFDLTKNYILCVGGRIGTYAQYIMKSCFDIFSRGDSGGVLDSTFGPIFELFKIHKRFKLEGLDAKSLEIEKVFDTYYRLQKLKSRVGSTAARGKILEFFGLILHRFSDVLGNKANIVKLIFNKTIKATKKKKENYVIQGLFNGFSFFLHNFKKLYKKDELKVIYEFTKEYMIYTGTPYDTTGNALNLFSKHSQLFKEFLVDKKNIKKQEYVKLFYNLSQQGSHHNEKVRKPGFNALMCYVSQILEIIKQDPNDSDLKEIYGRMKAAFFKIIKLNPQKSNTKKYFVSSGIVCFGKFAGGIKLYEGEKSLFNLMNTLFLFGEKELEVEGNLDYSSYYISYLLQSFSEIIIELDSVGENIVDHLFKLIKIQISTLHLNYHFRKVKFRICQNILKVCLALYYKEDSLNELLQKITSFSVKYAISAFDKENEIEKRKAKEGEEEDVDDDDEEEVEKKSVSVFSLTSDLWIDILKPQNLDFEKSLYPWYSLKIDKKKKDEIQEKIYDNLIQVFLECINQFDLVVLISEDGIMTPKFPRNFELFVNFVNFWDRILNCDTLYKRGFFHKWTYSFFSKLIERSELYPNSKGLLTLFTKGINICRTTGYFGKNYKGIERDNVLKLITNYCERMIINLSEKNMDVKDALKFLLSLPLYFIDIEKFTKPLCLAFEYGLTFYPIANIALNTLDYWLKKKPQKEMEKLTKKILPILSKYLTIERVNDTEKKTEDEIQRKIKSRKKTRITKIQDNKQKRNIENIKKTIFSEGELTDLREIQFRIVRLLGKFGGKSYVILDNNKACEVKWDNQKKVKLKLLFRDVRSPLYFDNILPRVLDLAENSGDREMKVRAGELLHSLVLLTVGDTVGTQNSKYHKVYKRIFPVCITLACGEEKVNSRIFMELCKQLVAWFTKSKEFENKDTMVLLDSILEGLVDQEKGKVREFCGNLMSHFLKYSLKHDENRKLNNVESVLNRIFTMSQHPNKYKRIGAMTAFNHIYRDFRESKTLVSRFVFRSLKKMILSLKISFINEKESPSQHGIISKNKQVIGHLIKMIIRFREMLNKVQKAKDIENFPDMVIFVFKQTGNIENECRNICQSILPKLIICLSGFDRDASKIDDKTILAGSCRRWFSSKIQKEGVNFVLDIAEQFSTKKTDLDTRTKELYASIDCYNWLFTEGFVKPHEVYPFSQILTQLKDYLEQSDLDFNKSTCNILLKIFEFVSINVEKFKETFTRYIGDVISKRFIRYCVITIIHPHKLRFDLNQPMVRKRLLPVCRRIITCISKTEKKEALIEYIRKYIIEKVEIFDDDQLTSSNIENTIILCKGLRILNEIGLIQKNSNYIDISQIVQEIFDNDQKMMIPLEKNIFREVLKMCFDFKVDSDQIITFLEDDSFEEEDDDELDEKISDNMDVDEEVEEKKKDNDGDVIMDDIKKDEIPKGELFYSNFKEVLNRYIIKNSKIYLPLIIRRIKKSTFFLKILHNIMRIIKKEEGDVINIVLEQSTILKETFLKKPVILLDKLMVLNIIRSLFAIDPKKLYEHENYSILYSILYPTMKIKLSSNEDGIPTTKLKLYSISILPELYNYNKKEVLKILRSIVNDDFPIHFTEIDVSSSKYVDHILLFKEVLNIFSSCPDIEILARILPLYKWDNHKLKTEMDEALTIFLKKISSKQDDDALSKIADICLDQLFNENLPYDVRNSSVQWICTKTLEIMSSKNVDNLISFYKKNYQRLLKDNQVFPDVFHKKEKLLTYTCCLNLHEIIVKLLGKKKIDQFELDFFKKKSKFKIMLLKWGDSARDRNFSAEEKSIIEQQYRINFHCAAFNLVARVLVTTQIKMKLFNKFLFQNKDYWSKIVDKNKRHFFDSSTEFSFQDVLNEVIKIGFDNVKKTKYNYIPSFNLTGTTLQDDGSSSCNFGNFTSFNIVGSQASPTTTTTIDTVSKLVAGGKGPIEEDEKEIELAPNRKLDENEKPKSVQLEMDEFNSHQCMAPILLALDLIFVDAEKEDDNEEIPKYVKTLQSIIMANPNPNVKLFLCKVIINRPDIFKCNKNDFFYILTDVAMNRTLGKNGKRGINYFFRDICILFLKWGYIPTQNASREVQLFIKDFIQRCIDSSYYIIKNNITLFDIFLVKWKKSIKLTSEIYQEIFRYLSDDDHIAPNRNKKRITGLAILDTFIQNGYNIFPPTVDYNHRKQLYINIIKQFGQHKRVQNHGTKIAGLILKNLKDESQTSILKEFLQLIENYLMKVWKEKCEKVLEILISIGAYYPEFIDTFKVKIFNIMPGLYGSTKALALKLILWRAGSTRDIFNQFMTDVHTNLIVKDETIQLLTLQIIGNAVNFLNVKQINKILDVIETNKLIENQKFGDYAREYYYKMLITFYDKKREFRMNEDFNFYLLRGMSDENKQIRKLLLEFWDNESRLSNEGKYRLGQLFSKLYSKKILGQKWLEFSTYLLLKLTTRDHEYNDKTAIFNKPLEENMIYNEMDMSDTLFHSVSSFDNLSEFTQFGSTSFSTLQFSPSSGRLKKRKKKKRIPPGQILATQQQLFSQTQTSSTTSNQFNASFSQSQYLFNKNENPSLSISNTVMQIPKYTDILDEKKNLSFIKTVPRRFRKIKDEAASNDSIIIRNSLRKHKRKEAWRERIKMQRKNTVSLLRNYRSGEIPDVMIKHSDIIDPLLDLCLVDSKIAKQLFIEVFNVVFKKLKKNNSDDIQTIRTIRQVIKKAIKHSKSNSILISSLFHVCLENKDLQLNLSCEEIKEASLGSYNIESGILLLEKIINNKIEKAKDDEINTMDLDSQETEQEKKTDIGHWVELAQLYKIIGEKTVVRSLFENHVHQHAVTKLALNHELNGSIGSSKKTYVEGIRDYNNKIFKEDNKPSIDEVKFWKSGILNCNFILNDRRSVLNNIKDQKLDVWADTHNLLPKFLESCLTKDIEVLAKFIEKSSLNQRKRDILEKKYSNILASVSIHNREFEKANAYILQGYGNFLREWVSFPSHSKKGKYFFLQKLNRLVELEEFYKFEKSKSKYKQNNFKTIIDKWEKRHPSLEDDDVTVWENFLSNRSFILDKIRRFFVKSAELEEEVEDDGIEEVVDNQNNIQTIDYQTKEATFIPTYQTVEYTMREGVQVPRKDDILGRNRLIVDTINNLQFQMYRIAAKASVKQSNFSTAQNILKKGKSFKKKDHSYIYDAIKLVINSDPTKDKNTEKFQEKIMHGLAFVDKGRKRHDLDEDNKTKYDLLKARIYEETFKGLKVLNIESIETSATKKKITVNSAVKLAYTQYNRIATSCEDDETGFNQISEKYRGKAYYRFASFANTIIQTKEYEKIDISTVKFFKSIVKYSLLSIKFNHEYVNELFPIILETIEKVKDSRDVFTRYVKNIPTWNFMFWISQIVPHLNGDEGEVLLPILIEFSKKYPQALYYPFNLSSKSLKPTSENVRLGIQQIILKFQVNDFEKKVKELMNNFFMLHGPTLKTKDLLIEISKLMYQKKGPIDKEAIQSVFQEYYNDVLVEREDTGNYYKQFISGCRRKITQKFGKDGKKILKMTANKFEKEKRAIFNLYKETKKIRDGKEKGKNSLLNFSKKLSDYKDQNLIELPGQYDKIQGKPNIKSHIKIFGFNENILIMNSLRKPKKIEILGSDEKEHSFLVKGGEDVRLDQRIEKLFAVINSFLRSDEKCRKNNLSIRCYDVIPLSTSVGLIEWINDCGTFKTMLHTLPIVQKKKVEYEKKYPAFKGNVALVQAFGNVYTKLRDIISKKIEKNVSFKGNEYYYYAFPPLNNNKRKKKKTDYVDFFGDFYFNKQIKNIPPYMLRDCFENMASSYESFYVIRNRFGKSLSVANLAGYILGIGDRHLDNHMVDMKSGTVIPIDFGYSFHWSQEKLGVPEFIPFRLTPQITNIFRPLTVDFKVAHKSPETLVTQGGIFIDTMVQVLDSIVKNKNSFISVLNVFIKEPITDWLDKMGKKELRNNEASKELKDDMDVDKKEEEEEEEEEEEKEEVKENKATFLIQSKGTITDVEIQEIQNIQDYTTKQVELIKQKLNFINPAIAIKMGVSNNKKIPDKNKETMLKTILGHPINYRYKFIDTTKDLMLPNSREVVKVLIDIATDPSILARTYFGWNPFA